MTTSATEKPDARRVVRFLTARRTVAPSLGVIGGLIVGSDAIRRLDVIAAWVERAPDSADLYQAARGIAHLQLGLAVTGIVFALLLAFVRFGRPLFAVGLIAVGMVLLVKFGIVINALPFLGGGVVAFLPNDWRLHPPRADRPRAPEGAEADHAAEAEP